MGLGQPPGLAGGCRKVSPWVNRGLLLDADNIVLLSVPYQNQQLPLSLFTGTLDK